MNTSMKIFLTLVLTAVTGAPVLAGHNGAYERPSFRTRINAKVTHVEPIIEAVEVAEPIQDCRVETVYSPASHHYSATPEIVGGIFGGLVGNQIGNGSGNVVATVAGVLLGSSIGHDMEARRYRHSGYSRPVQVCETRYAYHYEDQIVGYDVTYRYRGRLYRTRRDHHPGTHIRIQVRQ